MSRWSLGGRDMQTRNGNLVTTDQVQSIKHVGHMGTTTGKGVRQRMQRHMNNPDYPW
jgi:hypothetical protein